MVDPESLEINRNDSNNHYQMVARIITIKLIDGQCIYRYCGELTIAKYDEKVRILPC
jgi:N-formylglutamate amidohydrolase